MSLLTSILVLFLSIGVLYLFNYHLIFPPADLSNLEDVNFGSIDDLKLKQKTEITPFKINVDNSTLENLHESLRQTEFFHSLPDSNFNYGVNDEYLRFLRQHWLHKYDWNRWQDKLNSFSQFTTQQSGLQIHFVYNKAKKSNGKTVLLLHGWPGSFFEFYKLIPLLNDQKFDIVAPSIPGFGWSEKAQKKGLCALTTAKIFGQLMIERLKIGKFYCQGGDWGSLMCGYLAQLYPKNVLGIHLNMAPMSMLYAGLWAQVGIGYFIPSLIFDNPIDYEKVFPKDGKLSIILEESGYFHIQATKPDTIGFALLNSPMGLAGYILEKFTFWTSLQFRDLKDGGLIDRVKITTDEMLTNVMLYYVTSSILTSQRFYKEYVNHPLSSKYDRASILVPTGIAAAPNEPIKALPRNLLAYKYRNITSYDDLQRGGHFLALEEPELLADSIVKFIKTI